MDKDINMDQIIIHERLLIERRTRITVMSLLLTALIFTAVYGTLQDPFQYTFSKIGNRFDPGLRIVFITWSIYTGLAIQLSILALFRLENYKKKLQYIFIIVAVVFLVLTALLPSLEEWPFFQDLHIVAGGLFALFITIGFVPFMRWVAKENIRLRRAVYIWISVIWVGSISFMLLLGNTGVFELFFFCTFIIFLLYITLSLFEEQIIKRSVELLSGIEDLDRGIDDIFFPEWARKKRKKRNKQK
jgi:hypothetical protein